MTCRTGGCLCGNIRYELSAEPLAVCVCHCRNCQKQAGSALSVVAVYARPALTVHGRPKVFEDRGTSGQKVFRNFCPECGSPVITDTERAREQGIIFIKAGTLDDPTDLKPTTHYWAKRAHDWFVMPPDAEIREQE